MISTQGDSGRHTTRVNEEKCRFVGEVDLPESEQGDSILPPQPHSSCVKIWNHCWSNQDDDLCSFQFNTQMSVNSFIHALWPSHTVQTDMENVQASPGILLECGRDQLGS